MRLATALRRMGNAARIEHAEQTGCTTVAAKMVATNVITAAFTELKEDAVVPIDATVDAFLMGWRGSKGKTPGATAVNHGVYTSYAKGCRCDRCRSSWRSYRSAQRANDTGVVITPRLQRIAETKRQMKELTKETGARMTLNQTVFGWGVDSRVRYASLHKLSIEDVRLSTPLAAITEAFHDLKRADDIPDVALFGPFFDGWTGERRDHYATFPHGTPQMFNAGCRCEKCKGVGK